MTTCPLCKIENPIDANFCGICGNKLPLGKDIIGEYQKLERENKKTKNWTVFFGVLCIVVCGFAFYIINKQASTINDKNTIINQQEQGTNNSSDSNDSNIKDMQSRIDILIKENTMLKREKEKLDKEKKENPPASFAIASQQDINELNKEIGDLKKQIRQKDNDISELRRRIEIYKDNM